MAYFTYPPFMKQNNYHQIETAYAHKQMYVFFQILA